MSAVTGCGEANIWRLLLVFFMLLCRPSDVNGAHGVSIDGELKYPEGFTSFEYVSSKAQKGGRLTLHDIGSFDKTNPFSLKGEAPLGIEQLVFEPLAVSSLDEPFSLYGLLAEDIELADDKKSVLFTLSGDARFSDGSPVTPEDVGYTVDILKSDKAHPAYNYYYEDIAGYEIVDSRRIRIFFKKPNRELHLITAQMRIFPRSIDKTGFWGNGTSDDLLSVPIGSGPYVVARMDLGKTILYKRNPDYWGVNHPTRRYMFNFDEIEVKYFKDQIVALEAFKAGEFDFMAVNIAKQWARDLVGPKFASKKLIKKTFLHANNAGIQGFVMNTRKKIFSDILVRKAMGLAFDFEWANESLFHNQYRRNDSFFSNSYLAARGLPDKIELTYLDRFRSTLPQEVFTTPLAAPQVVGKLGLRKNLLEAKKLLEEAGWKVQNGILVDHAGHPFTFEILLVSPTFERVMASYVRNLAKLGIQASYRTIDATLYVDRVKKFDFDMIVATYGQSQSPGNEQRSYWHSSSADKIGSRNYAGIKSEVVDLLVEKIIYADDQKHLIAACRALDRVLWYGYYLVPNWYLPVHRLSYANSFSQPEKLPLYYSPFQLLMTWWEK
ncbi:extracellular solute-binding protein [Desulforhopalus singaporensis]|uniref:Microcin C transport system substrate-binding protein n=1 Tax=Desulforhopalus singaporensis TaxID=91360 RepID=A0A1H0PH06_9BACT|nr:extracellular solute-binding protein [Desulforhopalus singaporensis]SDP04341.1 microcin C transport system substrate-binding protein [Desulforhopalus singaporensis]